MISTGELRETEAAPFGQEGLPLLPDGWVPQSQLRRFAGTEGILPFQHPHTSHSSKSASCTESGSGFVRYVRRYGTAKRTRPCP